MKKFKNITLKLVLMLLATPLLNNTAKAETLDGALTYANAHQFTFQSIDGKAMPLSDYKGKILLIVNTASQCGFTKQYDGLQKLYDTYKDKGLVVIGVPCNDFGGQEPEGEETIAEFTEKQYGVTFPLTSKASVKGDDIHPFFKWAVEQGKGGFFFSKPKWNFHKFLIDTEGRLVKSFGSQVDPLSSDITEEIEKILPAQVK